jgi:glycosyltransferase involved in cell wall biosynthesis
MKRLIFLTQSVDPERPVLAATIPMIRAIAARVDEVIVLAQSGAGGGLPSNVEVHTFGAGSQLGRGWRFERELARALPADAVVAHMIPLYVLLAAPLVRPRRIPLLLWYTHWKASPLLRAAEKLATVIVSVDRRSFPLDSPKVRPIGHGIDLSEFTCTDRTSSEATGAIRALVLGRYSPAKGIETILRAAQKVEGVEVDLYGVALNELEQRHRRELEQLGFPLGGAVPRAQVPELFAGADLLVNNMEAGAPDKVVYEAAAACLPVLASNPVFDELFSGYPLSFDRDSPESLADRLRWFAALDADERGAIGRKLRERVASSHSVDTWAEGILKAAA